MIAMTFAAAIVDCHHKTASITPIRKTIIESTTKPVMKKRDWHLFSRQEHVAPLRLHS